MKRTAFASLIGVSKQMVSKYEADGLVVVADGEVDPHASLAALEGRLDEGKRLRAVSVLDQVAAPAAGTAPASRLALAPQPASAKAQKDQVELQLRQLELGQKAGQLVDVEEVAETCRHAVDVMRESYTGLRREIAGRICLRFDIAPDRATALARMLGDEFETALGAFAAALEQLTGDAAAGAAPAEAASVH